MPKRPEIIRCDLRCECGGVFHAIVGSEPQPCPDCRRRFRVFVEKGKAFVWEHTDAPPSARLDVRDADIASVAEA